jgi:hypothetical protein
VISRIKVKATLRARTIVKARATDDGMTGMTVKARTIDDGQWTTEQL